MVLAAPTSVTKQLALAKLDRGEPVRLLGGAVYLQPDPQQRCGVQPRLRPHLGLPADHHRRGRLDRLDGAAGCARCPGRCRSAWSLGGALGNLTDRIFRAPGAFLGHVVDMISLFGPYGQSWPVFNLADSSLVCGVMLAVLLELTGRQRDGRARREPTGTGGDGRPTAAAEVRPNDRRERA